MTADALFKMAWDPTPYINGNTTANALAFYADWAVRQLGVDATGAAAFVSTVLLFLLLVNYSGRIMIYFKSSECAWCIHGELMVLRHT